MYIHLFTYFTNVMNVFECCLPSIKRLLQLSSRLVLSLLSLVLSHLYQSSTIPHPVQNRFYNLEVGSLYSEFIFLLYLFIISANFENDSKAFLPLNPKCKRNQRIVSKLISFFIIFSSIHLHIYTYTYVCILTVICVKITMVALRKSC